MTGGLLGGCLTNPHWKMRSTSLLRRVFLWLFVRAFRDLRVLLGGVEGSDVFEMRTGVKEWRLALVGLQEVLALVEAPLRSASGLDVRVGRVTHVYR
jgi:hypothetical protein